MRQESHAIKGLDKGQLDEREKRGAENTQHRQGCSGPILTIKDEGGKESKND